MFGFSSNNGAKTTPFLTCVEGLCEESILHSGASWGGKDSITCCLGEAHRPDVGTALATGGGKRYNSEWFI
jgi:hypothetical protein